MPQPPITEILDQLRGVQQKNDYYTAQCPAHDDHRNSLQIGKQQSGKITLTCHAGCHIDEICYHLGIQPKDLYPDSPTSKPFEWEHTGHLAAKYTYTDEHGVTVFEVLRSVYKDFAQRAPDPTKRGGYRYSTKGIAKPLYNLPAVLRAIQERRMVLFVEGEKDVHTAAAHNITATCVAGGVKAPWLPAYTSILADANLYVIPDNDEPGRDLAHVVLKNLPNATLVELPGLPPKGDLTDWFQHGGDRETLRKLCVAAKKAGPPQPLPGKRATDPFRALGYDDNQYYFLSTRSGQVVTLSSAQLSQKTSFLRLADLNYWQVSHYADPDSGRIDWTACANYLMNDLCNPAGFFDPDRIRGRGAWLEGDTTVLHLGDRLLVNGKPVALHDHQSDYIYPAARKLRLTECPPLSDTDARALSELCRSLRWAHPMSGYYLAGWMALTPICGALEWRPHIWVSGPAGSGKSTVLSDIIGATLADLTIKVQSTSTEAGIRQSLDHDALPITFDEAELSDERGQAQIARVLDLARQASSAEEAAIVKGSANGKAARHMIRSMFCFASISIALKNAADESRVVLLELAPPNNQNGHYKALQDTITKICTPHTGSALVARSTANAAAIRANAETFALVLTPMLGTRRAGDQIGALLAGWWSLQAPGTVTLDEAQGIIAELPLSVAEVRHDDESDEMRCLHYLLERKVRLGADEISIGELVDMAREEDHQEAIRALARHGISPKPDGLLIAIRHSELARLLRGTQWASNWGTFLARIPGSKSGRDVKTVKMSGVVHRCVFVPGVTVLPAGSL